MKNSFIVIILSIVVAFILLVSLIYLIILPYFVPAGLPHVPEQGRSIRTGNETVSFQVIKIAHSLPRYHPLHQALSQDFATVLETVTDLRLIAEIYPEGSLGPDDQILKGTSRGTVEICLIRDNTGSYDRAPSDSLTVLTAIAGPSKYIWKISDKLSSDSGSVAVMFQDAYLEGPLIDLGFTPVSVSQDLLTKIVREGRAEYVVLDLLDWYYKDWNQWTVSQHNFRIPETRYFLVANADFVENLDAELHDALIVFAGRFGESASEMIEQSENEIITYSGLNRD